MAGQEREKNNEEFEREKLCYEQNYLQFRSLNQIMWQVPILAMTLTGGLWFGVAKVDTIKNAQYGLLLLAFFWQYWLILVLRRTRYVMGEYLKAIKKFYPSAYVEAIGTNWLTRPERVSSTFQCLLCISAFLSVVGIGIICYSPIESKVGQDKTKVECNG